MGVFTFVCKESGSDWTAKQLNGDLEATADSTFALQRKLVQAAHAVDSGAAQSSFSFVTPKSAVFQVFFFVHPFVISYLLLFLQFFPVGVW